MICWGSQPSIIPLLKLFVLLIFNSLENEINQGYSTQHKKHYLKKAYDDGDCCCHGNGLKFTVFKLFLLLISHAF